MAPPGDAHAAWWSSRCGRGLEKGGEGEDRWGWKMEREDGEGRRGEDIYREREWGGGGGAGGERQRASNARTTSFLAAAGKTQTDHRGKVPTLRLAPAPGDTAGAERREGVCREMDPRCQQRWYVMGPSMSPAYLNRGPDMLTRKDKITPGRSIRSTNMWFPPEPAATHLRACVMAAAIRSGAPALRWVLWRPRSPMKLQWNRASFS